MLYLGFVTIRSYLFLTSFSEFLLTSAFMKFKFLKFFLVEVVKKVSFVRRVHKLRNDFF